MKLATGDGTTLADRKRRAGLRMVLGVTTLDGDLRAALRWLRPGGFYLGADCVEEAAQVRELATELASLGDPHAPPLIVALPSLLAAAGGTDWPSGAQLGQVDREDITRQAGRGVSRELAALGVHGLAGPSAELGGFSDDPQRAAVHVTAWVQGLQSQGLFAAPGRYPGQGSADEGPIDRDAGDLEHRDRRPFQDSGAHAITLSSSVFPALDDEHPAWRAPAVWAGLRGWTQVPALTEPLATTGPLRGLGADLLLCEQGPATWEALVHLQEHSKAEDDRAVDALRRTMGLRRQVLGGLRPDLSVLGSLPHRSFAAMVRAG